MSSLAAGLVHVWRHVWNMEVSMHVILSRRARPCLAACLEHGGLYACHQQQLDMDPDPAKSFRSGSGSTTLDVQTDF